jgi:hypothetical protein
VVSATGVVPSTHFLHPLPMSPATSESQSQCRDNQTLHTEEGIDLNARDGSILVNECFQTSVDHVFAAGDCCSVVLGDDTTGNPDIDMYHSSAPGTDMQRQHWFQMRLWSQVRLTVRKPLNYKL